MASAIPIPPTSLIHQVHRITPLTMAQPPSSNGGAWHTLIQAHLANIASHKTILETLAQNMSQQENLDQTLVENMEAMYSRTVEIMQQAQGVKGYFDDLAPSRSNKNTQYGQPRDIAPVSRPTIRPRAPQRNAPTTQVTGRRQRSELSNEALQQDNCSKRRRLVDTSCSLEETVQTPPVQEAGVEYVDVSKEVFRRLAASRQRRMANKLGVSQEPEDRKRKRQRRSSGSERSITHARQVDPQGPSTKRLRSGPTEHEEESFAAKEVEECFASAEEDDKPKIPGAFEDSAGPSKKQKNKQRMKRTKSIV